jgi:hypothetical protein
VEPESLSLFVAGGDEAFLGAGLLSSGGFVCGLPPIATKTMFAVRDDRSPAFY